MKKALIVTYELKNPGKNYESLLQRINSYKFWARLNASSYVIMVESGTTVAQHRDYFLEVLFQNDKIYIGALGKEAAWYGLPDDVANWIKQNQK